MFAGIPCHRAPSFPDEKIICSHFRVGDIITCLLGKFGSYRAAVLRCTSSYIDSELTTPCVQVAVCFQVDKYKFVQPANANYEKDIFDIFYVAIFGSLVPLIVRLLAPQAQMRCRDTSHLLSTFFCQS